MNFYLLQRLDSRDAKGKIPVIDASVRLGKTNAAAVTNADNGVVHVIDKVFLPK